LPGQWHGRTLILLLLVLVQWAALVPLLQYKDMTDLHASVTDWFQHVSTFLRLFAAVS
jgi:vacuolar-type H+-ATPase subunit I/STV1